MYRRSGFVALTLGALLVYILVFTPFNQELNRWTKNEAGNRVKVVVVCDSPWSIFVADAEQDLRFRSDAETCERGARFQATIGVVFALASLVLGVRGIIRGPRPEPRRLTPLRDLFDMWDR